MAQFTENTLELLHNRYFLRDTETGEVIEKTPEEMFRRVAKHIASAEKEEFREFYEEKFYWLMDNQYFMPNTPTLINAGKEKCLSACSVIGRYPDSLDCIYEYLWYNAKLTKYGCGVGQDLSSIRPKGEIIKSSGGASAGVVNWMELIQAAAETTIQGDTARRAANMVSLRFNHPDIFDFIVAKDNNDKYQAMNISVVITDQEFKKAINREEIELEWNGKKYGKVNAGEILDKIVEQAWKNGEPGLIFIDRINQFNPFNVDGNMDENHPHYMKTTNPCFAGHMRLLTAEGYKTFEELDGKEVEIINADGFITKGKVWCTGEKKTIELVLSNNSKIVCTPNHVFKTVDGNEVEAKDLNGIKIMPAVVSTYSFDDKFIKLGFIQGNGNLTRLNSERHKGIEVNIGSRDSDVLELFKSDDYTRSDRKIYLRGYNDLLVQFGFDASPLHERKFPSTYDLWYVDKKRSFLRGCYSANGSVIKRHRISYKTTSIDFATKLVETLKEDFDIDAYITVNKARETEFSNGTYMCKQSYNIEISKYDSIYKFASNIGFVQKYKNESLKQLLIDKAPYVRRIDDGEVIKVYDFSEPITHWGIVEGFVVHNCGEQPLEDFEFCNLGSINLEKMYHPETKFDKDLLAEVIKYAVRFLDNVNDVNEYVLPQFKEKVLANRKIGLGVTGFAHLLILNGIRYDSQEALDLIDELYSFMNEVIYEIEEELALEKGVFPEYEKSIWAEKGILMRNAAVTTQAPTGSISSILNTVAYGIEPLFSVGYIRRIVTGEILEVNDLFRKMLLERVSDEVLANKIIYECIEKGTTELDIVPKDLRNLFRCANDISPEWHIKIVAQIQKYVHNSISKTVNLPENATKDDIRRAYIQSFNLGLKGCTVYRNNSREGQTIQIGTKTNNEKPAYKDLPRGVVYKVSDDLVGKKRKLQTGCGSIHLQAWFHPVTGDLMEVFFDKGSDGGCISFTNALSRMTSVALRSGAPIEAVLDQLNSIFVCPSYAVRRATKKDTSPGSSCPNAIGMALKEMYEEVLDELGVCQEQEDYEEYYDEIEIHEQNIQEIAVSSKSSVFSEEELNYLKSYGQIAFVKKYHRCPECGEPIMVVEGCLSCYSCGFSKCS